MRYGLYEHVPGDDEVGEDEEDGSEGEQAASLQEGCKHHDADQACVDCDADADEFWLGGRNYAGENYCQECQSAEYDHGEVAFHLRGELPVPFDFREVSSREIYDVHYVREREKTHLAEEVAAGTEVVAGCREKEGEGYLPWAQP